MCTRTVQVGGFYFHVGMSKHSDMKLAARKKTTFINMNINIHIGLNRATMYFVNILGNKPNDIV